MAEERLACPVGLSPDRPDRQVGAGAKRWCQPPDCGLRRDIAGTAGLWLDSYFQPTTGHEPGWDRASGRGSVNPRLRLILTGGKLGLAAPAAGVQNRLVEACWVCAWLLRKAFPPPFISFGPYQCSSHLHSLFCLVWTLVSCIDVLSLALILTLTVLKCRSFVFRIFTFVFPSVR